MNRDREMWRMLVLIAAMIGGWAGCSWAASDAPPARVAAHDVQALRTLVGQAVTVSGRVSGTGVSGSSGHQFLNFDNREFSVICFADDLDRFTAGQPAELYKGRDIEITGVLERYRDKLQIRLREPSQIKLAGAPPDQAAPSGSGRVPAAASEIELKKVGPNTWLSPAGLRYQGRDPDGRTRIEHVLRHARDIPDREGSHGVFDGGPEAVFGVIDEAWRNVERKRIRPTIEGDRSLYTVPMSRRVGYLGGRAGASRGHPPLTRIFLVIETETKNVITAFPR
ncbi:MAG: hypothetical protein GX575_14470 [Candidatus Anammoximicrobium sp.]|nr:hypothetical protein [Candidatus Anammoximicrobium sp.]